ncbi:MAG: YvcK family protein [Fimbriimonadaceae bacterium]
MIKRYKFRRLIAPTAGFRKALILTAIGLFIFLIGLAYTIKQILIPLGEWTNSLLLNYVSKDELPAAVHWLGLICLILGGIVIVLGVNSAIRHMMETIYPTARGGMVDMYRRRQQLAQGPNIVAIGGGTGLSTLLRGLKQHSSNITAIVTVTDDGGSSGRLTQEMGIIPPGDIRNCLVALADAEKSMTDLFQHRFTKGGAGLTGHSMGNLLIAAMVEQSQGDFEKAVVKISDVLAIRGRVIPSTLDHVRLRAILDDGTEVCGETKIVEAGRAIRQLVLDPPNVEPHHGALHAIGEADIIVIGPGSVYTSLIPNMLVPGIAQAVRESHAIKVYVCNVMTQPGESDKFTACEHVTGMQTNVKVRVFDYVLINNAMPSQAAIEKYREVGQHYVEPDADRIRAMGFRVITGDFMNESDFVRHDPNKVADKLMQLVER